MKAPNPNTDTTTTTAGLDNTIDALLERYLILLDEYTTLRSSLNQLQSGIYQNIARANFSAERGIRYGQDHYDERMQALRRVVIQPAQEGTADETKNGNAGGSITFSVVKEGGEQDPEKSKGGEEEKSASKEEQEGGEKDVNTPKEPAATSKSPPTVSEEKNQDQQQQQEKEDDSPSEPSEKGDTSNLETEKKSNPATSNKKKPANPLRWFGLLTPQPLRQAQSQAIKAVEEILPRLVSVNMAMAEVELEVRRARKKRTKAAAAAAR